MVENVLEEVIAYLLRHRQTLALAESCTAGLVSAAFGAVPGVSRIFLGAVVSYSNSAKEDLLDVPSELLRTFGAVSEPVAARMAEGARVKLKSSWAVSITGIAGPDGGSLEKPVGTVCFAVAGPKLGVRVRETQMITLNFTGNRQGIQEQAVQAALNFLREQLLRVS